MIHQSFRFLSFTHVLLAGTIALLLIATGHSWFAASFGIGATVMLLSTLVMAWSVWRLLEQKTIALTIAVIVIKYAVLLASLYYLAQCDWLQPLGVVMGVFSFTMAALIYAGLEYKKETKFGRAF